jgi:hypothetical protein
LDELEMSRIRNESSVATMSFLEGSPVACELLIDSSHSSSGSNSSSSGSSSNSCICNISY